MIRSNRPTAGAIGLYRHERGFNLIEVMIALFVLAIGLLGMAGLQTKALEYNHNAYLRTQATSLAYDMIDRMRGNRALVIGSNNYVLDFGTTLSAPTQNCQTSCTPVQLAAHDLYVWRQAVENLLPSGGSQISVNTTTGVVTIQIRFDENRGRDPDNVALVPVVIQAVL